MSFFNRAVSPPVNSGAYVKFQAPVNLDLAVQVTIPASADNGSTNLFTIAIDPTIPSNTSTDLKVYSGEYWYVYNVYSPVSITAFGGTDGVVRFKVNGTEQQIQFGPMSQTLKSFNQPVSLKNAVLAESNDTLQPQYILNAANGTASETINLIMQIKRVPNSYKGPITL